MMTNETEWFKCVRPNLTSWHDLSFQYVIGKRARPLGKRQEGVLCAPGYLHASPTPAEATRYNATWPWKIIRVAGTPAVVDPDGKGGFRQLTPTGIVPVWRSFGPNGREVLRLVRRCEALRRNEVDFLASSAQLQPTAWPTPNELPPDEHAEWARSSWAAAWNAAVLAARGETGRLAIICSAWAAVRDAGRQRIAEDGSPVSVEWRLHRSQRTAAAWDAAGAAARAVAIRDLITPDGFTQTHFDVLTGVWVSVFGKTWEVH
jgi:hypothetical protein